MVKIDNLKFQFVNTRDQSLNGEKQFKIVNKGFVPTKEYQKNNFATSMGKDVYLVTM